MKWLARAKAELFLNKPKPHTAKTDETPLLAVLAVPRLDISGKTASSQVSKMENKEIDKVVNPAIETQNLQETIVSIRPFIRKSGKTTQATPQDIPQGQRPTREKETLPRASNEAEIPGEAKLSDPELEKLNDLTLTLGRAVDAGKIPDAIGCKIVADLFAAEIAGNWGEFRKLMDEAQELVTNSMVSQKSADLPKVGNSGKSADLPNNQDLRDERAAIHEYDGNLGRDEAEARASYAFPCTCGGTHYWVSAYGPVRCAACHPPAIPERVVRWQVFPTE